MFPVNVPKTNRAQKWRPMSLLLAALFSLAMSGCGNGLADVSGQVTLDGHPLRAEPGKVRVTIQFQPASGVGPTAIGLADENGNYVLGTGSQTGIPPGDYLVACSAGEILSDAVPHGKMIARPITDSKYANAKTSGLRFTVQSGSNEFNIPLQSQAKKPLKTGG
jgi:hypothetical protein